MEGYKPAFVYPFAVNGFLSVTQVLNVIYGDKLSDRWKIQVPFAIGAVLVLSLPFIAHYSTSPGQAYYICFVVLLFFGVVNGVVQGQVFGTGGILPPKYIGAVMFGNGLSGITVNLIKILLNIVLPGPENLFKSSLVFYVISALILLGCSVAFSVMEKNVFYKYYKKLGEEFDQSIIGETTYYEKTGSQNPNFKHKKGDLDHKTLIDVRASARHERHGFDAFWHQFKINFRSAWKIIMSLYFVFFITFVVFPGAFLDSHFKMMNNIGDTEFSWYSITIITTFNVCDTIGRKLGGIVMIKPRTIYISSLLRTIFIITTIIIANYDQNGKVKFMENDFFRIANLVLFSISNGYVSTQCAV